jgi:hypothetical protein
LWNDAEEHVIVSGEHFEVGYKCQGWQSMNKEDSVDGTW